MSKKKSPVVTGPRKAPKQDRSRQTYQVILQGANRVIRRDGIQKFSTNRVAEESGVSIGSLYQYFPSKEAIVAALIDQAFDVEYQKLKLRIESLSPEIGSRQAMREILRHYFDRDRDDLAYRKALIDLMGSVGKVTHAMRFHRAMCELIWTGLRLKFKEDATSDDEGTTIFLMTYLLRGVAHSSVDENFGSVNKDFLIDEIVSVWLHLLRIPIS